MSGDLTSRTDKAPAQKVNPTSAVHYGPDVVFYYLSEVLDNRVRYEDEARPFGRLHDIGASAGTPYPQAICLDVKCDGAERRILPWSVVQSLSPREIVIRRETNPPTRADFWGRRDVLDDQVVDVSGARVLRVNDVHLIYSDKKLIFGHVEVGILGILRRLRFEKPVSFLLRWLFDYSIRESFVTWRHIEVLSPGGVPGGLRVSRLPERLADIHPAELADIMEQLGTKDRQVLFDALSVKTAARALEEITPGHQWMLVARGEPTRLAEILQEMPPKEAADVLRDFGSDAQTIVSRMEDDAAADVKTILAHEEKTVGSVMSTACLEAGPGETASEVIARVRATGDEAEVFNHIYVLDNERHLLGLLTLKELLRASDGAPLQDLMKRNPITIAPVTHLRNVARLFVKYGFRAIPVVDDRRVFLGAVRFHGVLPELAQYLKK